MSILSLNDVRVSLKDTLTHDFAMLFTLANLPVPLGDASRYAIENGGKRVRPLLVQASFLTLVGDGEGDAIGQDMVRRAMLAVELIHGYSLVHDDLPCMDDDDLRRGKPTCHMVYGEAVALLVGDVLQSLAFDALSMPCELAQDLLISIKLQQILAPRARRMVAGQQADLNGEGQQLAQDELERIHKDKTGAMIEASILMGAVCAGADDEVLGRLQEYAQFIGLAYQVQDDVLDVVADVMTLGKPTGSDVKLQKSTYVALLGVTQARHYADELFDRARACVVGFGCDNLLLQMVDWLQKRDY